MCAPQSHSAALGHKINQFSSLSLRKREKCSTFSSVKQRLQTLLGSTHSSHHCLHSPNAIQEWPVRCDAMRLQSISLENWQAINPEYCPTVSSAVFGGDGYVFFPENKELPSTLLLLSTAKRTAQLVKRTGP
ncbi:hypothetical protein AVEN_87676-1 [Araneus ventricosus]|uniref:Uncharacterized protein n=1 Tax=Araneus ventricosus TaxID=182803 RepID=A0A4Y2CZA6_ARAVE|nr:hypothetical protein AVEN_87676-1 [Araneus ventricosus]